MMVEGRCTKQRSKVTPALFWLGVFEMFYYTGIRLNALLTLRYKDVDWLNKIITVRADTEKTHREFSIPIMPGLEPHILRLLEAAREVGFAPDDQLFNVNRFSLHYRSVLISIDQIEGTCSCLARRCSIQTKRSAKWQRSPGMSLLRILTSGIACRLEWINSSRSSTRWDQHPFTHK